jgi:hypothetical protein
MKPNFITIFVFVVAFFLVEISASQMRQVGLTEIDKKLIEAVQARDIEGDAIEKIEFLISKGADVNAGNEHLKPSLHTAEEYPFLRSG